MRNAPSAKLLHLAELIRAQLLGEPEPALPITAELASYAILRHRVGPLLNAAAQRIGSEAAAAERLAKHAHQNRYRLAVADIALQEIAAAFFAARIPWLVFKGLPLSRRLYPDPSWRSAHDVDVLVSPEDFCRTSQTLRDRGFVVGNTVLSSEHWIESLLSSLAKDVMFHQARSGVLVELHRRLFFAGYEVSRAPLLRMTFQPRLGRDVKDVPSPEIDAGLALYLLLHGASCRWFRLKWLADLLPLLGKLDDNCKRSLADAAEIMKAAPTVKAGFMLLIAIFGEVPLGPLQTWLSEPSGRVAAERRMKVYLAALDNPAGTEGKRAGDRFDALDMHLSLMSGAGYRSEVLLRGGAWTALCILRDRWTH